MSEARALASVVSFPAVRSPPSTSSLVLGDEQTAGNEAIASVSLPMHTVSPSRSLLAKPSCRHFTAWTTCPVWRPGRERGKGRGRSSVAWMIHWRRMDCVGDLPLFGPPFPPLSLVLQTFLIGTTFSHPSLPSPSLPPSPLPPSHYQAMTVRHSWVSMTTCVLLQVQACWRRSLF